MRPVADAHKRTGDWGLQSRSPVSLLPCLSYNPPVTAAIAPHIELRPLDRDHYPVAFLWLDKHWAELAADEVPRDCDGYFNLMHAQRAYIFGVWADDVLGGMITLIPRSLYKIEGHTIFKESFQDRRYTVPAFRQAIKWCFDNNWHKIAAPVFPQNLPMIKLLTHMGAHKEGVSLEEIKRGGEWQDIVQYCFLQ